MHFGPIPESLVCNEQFGEGSEALQVDKERNLLWLLQKDDAGNEKTKQYCFDRVLWKDSSQYDAWEAAGIGVVKGAMEDAKSKIKGLALQLDTTVHLPPPAEQAQDGASCSGGVHILSSDGKTTCNNSLDDRLRVSFERNLPEIRAMLFGENPSLKA